MTDSESEQPQHESHTPPSRREHASSSAGSETASLSGQPLQTAAPSKADSPQGTYEDAEITQEIEDLLAEDQFKVDKLRFGSKIVFRTIQDDLKDEQVAKFAQKIATVLLRAKDTNAKVRQILTDTDGIALR